jgi:hypothetical protein
MIPNETPHGEAIHVAPNGRRGLVSIERSYPSPAVAEKNKKGVIG